jgi:hypothetical protein
MKHGDRLDVGAKTFWVSCERLPDQTEYVPETHGSDVFCFITKARLQENEPITICPGRSGVRCGMIYKRAAWDLALESSTFKCPNCQFDPHAATWEPPAETPTRSLSNLLRLLMQDSAR